MKSLKNLLDKRVTKKTSLTDKDAFYIFKKVIREEFGAVGIEKLKPYFFKNGTIFVRSESSAWLSELWINKNRIIRKINEELGEDLIKNIKTK